MQTNPVQPNREDRRPAHQKAAVLTAAFLALLSAASLACLLSPGRNGTGYTADIYRNDALVMSIPLDGPADLQSFTPSAHASCQITVPENQGDAVRIFTIENEDGGINEIEIRAGGIAVISASCPDRLCVRRGFARDAKLPIVCLPNRLVIRLRPTDGAPPDDAPPDAVAY